MKLRTRIGLSVMASITVLVSACEVERRDPGSSDTSSPAAAVSVPAMPPVVVSPVVLPALPEVVVPVPEVRTPVSTPSVVVPAPARVTRADSQGLGRDSTFGPVGTIDSLGRVVPIRKKR